MSGITVWSHHFFQSKCDTRAIMSVNFPLDIKVLLVDIALCALSMPSCNPTSMQVFQKLHQWVLTLSVITRHSSDTSGTLDAFNCACALLGVVVVPFLAGSQSEQPTVIACPFIANPYQESVTLATFSDRWVLNIGTTYMDTTEKVFTTKEEWEQWMQYEFNKRNLRERAHQLIFCYNTETIEYSDDFKNKFRKCILEIANQDQLNRLANILCPP